MKWFASRLAVVTAGAFVSMMVAAPAISSASCDPNMAYNWATNECKPPPAMPSWYVPPPQYAPSFAGQDVPPPPPKPWWSPYAPMWSTGFHQWGAYFTGTWVPY